MSKRICVFGDSIGQGYFDNVAGGWVERLSQDFLNASEDYYSIFNLSVSGDLSEDVLNRCENEIFVRHPEIVIFAIGINDATFDIVKKENRVTIKEFEKNIEKLIEIIETKSLKAVFVGLTKSVESKTIPVAWDENLHYLNEDIEKYNNALSVTVQKHNIDFVDVYDVLDDEDLPDGLHPNAKGHEKMFKKMRDFLIENNIIT